MFALEIFLQLQFATSATGEQRRGAALLNGLPGGTVGLPSLGPKQQTCTMPKLR